METLENQINKEEKIDNIMVRSEEIVADKSLWKKVEDYQTFDKSGKLNPTKSKVIPIISMETMNEEELQARGLAYDEEQESLNDMYSLM